MFCGLLMSLGAFSIDISLPFFSVMADGLDTDLSLLPLVVTSFLLFLGLGQLLFGPLSDRIGRKPTLMLGLSLFLLGAFIAGSAVNFSMVIVGRVLQGFGTSAAVVLSRTILRDLFEGENLARQMAIATGIFSVGPIVAPLLGGTLVALGASWRSVFVAMVLYGLLLLFFLSRTPETLREADPEALSLARLKRNLMRVVCNEQSRSFMVINSVTMISMILIVATSAPLYKNRFGITGVAFAIYFAVHASGIIVGQFANHRLISRLGVVCTSIAAAAVMALAGVLIVLFEIAGLMSPWLLSGLITLFAVGYLSVVANSTSMILQPHGEIAGFTSSLQGACGLLVSSVVGTLLSRFVQDNLALWGGIIALIPLLAIVLLVRWQSRPLNQPG